MNPRINYRPMKHGDENAVFDFVSRVFKEFVAPGFSPQGVAEFMDYIRPEAVGDLLARNHTGLIAVAKSGIAGMILLRDGNHVALFFVDGPYQRRGIGRELLRRALEACSRGEDKAHQITVNASLNSLPAYRKLNFSATDTEQCVNGIRFVPMALRRQPGTPYRPL